MKYKQVNQIIMAVCNKIQYDARVIRSAETIADLKQEVLVISCNSNVNYNNKKFKSIVFQSKKQGHMLLISFWFYVMKFCIKNRKKICLLYMHDYYMAIVGHIVSRLIKKDWVYDGHELLLQRKNTVMGKREKFFFLLEKKSIKSAKLVIQANDERKRLVASVYKLKNVISIANIAPLVLTKKDRCNLLKNDIIVYQGVMSNERKVSSYIERMKYLPVSYKLKLIGEGPDFFSYKEMVLQNSLIEKVIFTGKLPYEELVNESKECKIGIVSYLMDDLNNYYCAPNKLYEYAQFNIPVLVSPQPFLIKIVNEYKIGEILYPNISDREFCDLIIKMMENYNDYIVGIDKFLEKYSYEKEMFKLKDSIRKLL